MLLEDSSDVSIVVDTNWQQNVNEDRESDYVMCSQRSDRRSLGQEIELKSLGIDLDSDLIDGEWMGMLKVKKEIRDEFFSSIESVLESTNRQASIPDLLHVLMESGIKVNVIYTSGHWIDIDSLEDLVKASYF